MNTENLISLIICVCVGIVLTIAVLKNQKKYKQKARRLLYSLRQLLLLMEIKRQAEACGDNSPILVWVPSTNHMTMTAPAAPAISSVPSSSKSQNPPYPNHNYNYNYQ